MKITVKHFFVYTTMRNLSAVVTFVIIYRVIQKELYNGIPNVTVWRVLPKRLHLKEYKLSIVHGKIKPIFTNLHLAKDSKLCGRLDVICSNLHTII
jgi:hypothetical protein